MKKKIIGLVLMALVLTACSAPLEEINSLWDQGKREEALDLGRKLLLKEEDNIGLYLRLSYFYRELGQPQEAMELVEAGLELGESRELLLEKASLALLLEDYRLAEDIYRELLAAGDQEARELILEPLFYQAKYGELIASFTDLDKKSDQASYYYLYALGEESRQEEARTYIRGLDLGPETSQDLVEYISSFLAQEARPEELEDFLAKLVDLGHDSAYSRAYNYVRKNHAQARLLGLVEGDLDGDGQEELSLLLDQAGSLRLVVMDGWAQEEVATASLGGLEEARLDQVQLGDKTSLVVLGRGPDLRGPWIYQLDGQLKRINYDLDQGDLSLDLVEGGQLSIRSKSLNRSLTFQLGDQDMRALEEAGVYTSQGQLEDYGLLVRLEGQQLIRTRQKQLLSIDYGLGEVSDPSRKLASYRAYYEPGPTGFSLVDLDSSQAKTSIYREILDQDLLDIKKEGLAYVDRIFSMTNQDLDQLLGESGYNDYFQGFYLKTYGNLILSYAGQPGPKDRPQVLVLDAYSQELNQEGKRSLRLVRDLFGRAEKKIDEENNLVYYDYDLDKYRLRAASSNFETYYLEFTLKK